MDTAGVAEPPSSPSTAPALARLPAELVQLIASLMSIEDTKTFYNQLRRSKIHRSVAPLFYSRISVKRYIEANLGDPLRILDSMSKNLVYISGSGALEFFKPGCRDANSDWDFYAPNDIGLVSAFMWDMEQVGVKWRSPLDQVQKYMQENGGMVRLQRQTFVDVFGNKTLFRITSKKNFKMVVYRHNPVNNAYFPMVTDGVRFFTDTTLPPPLAAAIEFDSGDHVPFYNLNINAEAKIVTIEPGETWESYDSVLCIKRIISGELERENKRKVEIQVMVEVRDHPFDTASVFRFHSSVVQCFIGAHIACHYYGKAASRGITHVYQNFVGIERNEKVLQKYRDRGFVEEKIVDQPLGSSHRLGQEPHTTFMGGYNYTSRQDWVVDALVRHVLSTAWLESSHETTLIRSPFERKQWTANYLNDDNLVGHTRGLQLHPAALEWTVGERTSRHTDAMEM
ncbi:hypothetical protein BU23DRAFT_10001 [Bimuria novae-zelandiae CBS 107.79]|uniref:Uncharacterized protein n=1 Tax=Bimuria novae-zelandiae CBS 107.79 TaxID=1447943 RepID=A0A6A5W0A2_9PLEO|nr:hypothetical protein BU23DRAFT_10001 [Bimuria novae-zelandiae CBS 107.79]